MVASAQMIRTFDINSEALIPGQQGSRSLPVMGSRLAKLDEEPNVTVLESGCVTVDGNPSWCWILWKGEGIQKDCLEVLRRHQAG
ncbi:unnamed protein product [Prunus armeniaca]